MSVALAIVEVRTVLFNGNLGRQRRPIRFRTVLYGCGAGILIVILSIAARALLGGNLHTVVPGLIYRSAQPSAAELETICRDKGIRTVINLRGCGAPMDWYLAECRVTQRLNVSQENIDMSATRLPSPSEVRRLVEVLDHCEYPILIHCLCGADRTGLASTIAKLLRTDADLPDALQELTINFGHVRIGKAAQLDRFFQLYADWLAERRIMHTPDGFREFVADGYCPGEYRCHLQLLEAPHTVIRGQPAVLRLRAWNTSIKPWRLRPETNAGIHAGFTLFDAQNAVVHIGRAGLFEARVAPGECIDLTLVLPPVVRLGQYHLVVDMVDEQQCSFSETGSDLLRWELEVREQEVSRASLCSWDSCSNAVRRKMFRN
jgi:hypothetical protein